MQRDAPGQGFLAGGWREGESPFVVLHGLVPTAEADQDVPLHHQDLHLLLRKPGQHPAPLHDCEALLPQPLVEEAEHRAEQHGQEALVVSGGREQPGGTLVECGRRPVLHLLLKHPGFRHEQPGTRGGLVIARQ